MDADAELSEPSLSCVFLQNTRHAVDAFWTVSASWNSEVWANGFESREPISLIAHARTTVEPGVFGVQGTEVRQNREGDLAAFTTAIRCCVPVFALFTVFFLLLQRRYPKIYAYRVDDNWEDGRQSSMVSSDEIENLRTFKDDNEIIRNWWTWARLGLCTPTEDVEKSSGLDAAMLLQFTELAIELMFVMGVPMCLIGCPIFAFFGGGFAQDDLLSWVGIGNVVWESTALHRNLLPKAAIIRVTIKSKIDSVQWIFWLVAFSVWAVVLWTQYRIYCAQRNFIVRRRQWLLTMGEPRCTTLLVQGIPEAYRNDKSFNDFFTMYFPGVEIRNAFVIKILCQTKLSTLWDEKCDKEQQLREARFVLEGAQVENRNDVEMNIGQLESAVRQIRDNIELQQNYVKEDKPGAHFGYTQNGFVTFANRCDSERVLGLRMSENDDEWIFEIPPDPADVRYRDLEFDAYVRDFYHYLGYAAIAAMFLSFMPLVLAISNVALVIEMLPPVSATIAGLDMEPFFNGVASTVGLTIMMAMLPSCLMRIFKTFFILKSEAWAQLRLHEYYFFFLVSFVLLVTVVGTNFVQAFMHQAFAPSWKVVLIAVHLPVTTHFYLDYVLASTVGHGLNLMRVRVLIKYLFFKTTCDEDRARELCEPEDQDNEGIGCRSARFTLVLLIGIVFGTICPLMHAVVLPYFLAARLIYGYLIPFAETRKTDQGGEHWCLQLYHLQKGLVIYIVMMTGMLVQRARSKWPGTIAGVSIVVWFMSYQKFLRTLRWENLPYTQWAETGIADRACGNEAARKTNAKYCQSELEPVK